LFGRRRHASCLVWPITNPKLRRGFVVGTLVAPQQATPVFHFSTTKRGPDAPPLQKIRGPFFSFFLSPRCFSHGSVPVPRASTCVGPAVGFAPSFFTPPALGGKEEFQGCPAFVPPALSVSEAWGVAEELRPTAFFRPISPTHKLLAIPFLAPAPPSRKKKKNDYKQHQEEKNKERRKKTTAPSTVLVSRRLSMGNPVAGRGF